MPYSDPKPKETKASIPPPPPPPPPPPTNPAPQTIKKSASVEIPNLTASIAKEAAMKANAIQLRRQSKSR